MSSEVQTYTYACTMSNGMWRWTVIDHSHWWWLTIYYFDHLCWLVKKSFTNKIKLHKIIKSNMWLKKTGEVKNGTLMLMDVLTGFYWSETDIQMKPPNKLNIGLEVIFGRGSISNRLMEQCGSRNPTLGQHLLLPILVVVLVWYEASEICGIAAVCDNYDLNRDHDKCWLLTESK